MHQGIILFSDWKVRTCHPHEAFVCKIKVPRPLAAVLYHLRCFQPSPTVTMATKQADFKPQLKTVPNSVQRQPGVAMLSIWLADPVPHTVLQGMSPQCPSLWSQSISCPLERSPNQWSPAPSRGMLCCNFRSSWQPPTLPCFCAG